MPSKAFGMTHKMSRIDAEPKQKLLTPVHEFNFLLENDNDLKFLKSVYIQIIQVCLNFQNFSREGSMVILQIFTDCSVFDRFRFAYIGCLF